MVDSKTRSLQYSIVIKRIVQITDSCLEVSASGDAKCYTLPGQPELASRIFSACQDGDMCAITGQFDDKNEKLIQFSKAEKVAP